MSKRHRLEQLLQNPCVWKAGQGGLRWRTTSTGFADLDEALAGGWPAGCLIELLVERHGVGELGLLLPALTLRRERWVILIAPPYIPYAPAFARRGLDMSRLLVVHCHRPGDILWATEQALQSNACAAVLAWSEVADERALRRLQLVAEAGRNSLLVLFRPARLGGQRSPAALRIRLRPGSDETLGLEIFKNRGGRPQCLVVRVGRAEA